MFTHDQDIACEPLPKPRYTKKTIELRHAEKLLAQQQDYFNATRVRAKTKELEAVSTIRRWLFSLMSSFCSWKIAWHLKITNSVCSTEGTSFIEGTKQSRRDYLYIHTLTLALLDDYATGRCEEDQISSRTQPRSEFDSSEESNAISRSPSRPHSFTLLHSCISLFAIIF